jgi:hypothetical protein
VIDFLVGDAAIVLENVVIGSTRRVDDLLDDGLRAVLVTDYQL